MKLPQSFFPTVLAGVAGLSMLVSPSGFAAPTAACTSPVKVNVADVQCLMTVHGIGEKMADRIVQYREEHGQFKTLADLAAVKGISDKKLAKWQDELTVSDTETSATK